MNAPHKELPLNGSTYIVGRLPSEEGSWLAVLLTAKMNAARAEAQREAQPMAITDEMLEAAKRRPADEIMMETAVFLIAQLTRAELREVMGVCLAFVSKRSVMADVPVDIPVKVDGVWKVKELSFDGATVLQLTKEVIAFNIAPFFTGAGSSDQ